MKNYKVILISFVLLFFLIGAVSAAEDNSEGAIGDIPFVPTIPDLPIDIDPIDVNPIDIDPVDPVTPGVDVGGNTKDIYVNTTGDDSNVGSSESPYATIGKAIGDVNESQKVTIHLSEGTFASDNDANIVLEINQQVNGGSLTIVGSGVDKTFIDGQSAFNFASFYSNTNVTLKDISFINFKSGSGGVIGGFGGILTIENCIFKDSFTTGSYGGAIYMRNDGAVLNVKDSQFISCSVNRGPAGLYGNAGGGAIFADNIKSLTLENNLFVGTTIVSGSKGVAVFTNSKSYISGNKFINLTGTNDASIWINARNSVISNNEFINCSNPSTTSSILTFQGGSYELKNNTFINSSNSVGNIYTSVFIPGLNFTINDVIDVGNAEINNGVDVEINTTDDMGNIVCFNSVKMNFVNDDNEYDYYPSSLNGKAHITFYTVPEIGVYNVTVGDNDGNYVSDVLTTANIHYSNDLVELYVSPNGDDANNGTKELPFATIQHALDVGFEKTFNVTIHLLEGTYSGEENVNLIISNKGTLQIIGEKYNETIIDGAGENGFFEISTPTIIKNLKFINGYSFMMDLISGNSVVSLEKCIFDSNIAEGTAVISGCNLNNLTYINNKGYIDYGFSQNKFLINNSYFANNENLYGSAGVLKIGYETAIENCKFINNSASENGGVIVAQYELSSKNNYFEGNHALNGGVIYTYAQNYLTFENDVFFNNTAIDSGVIGHPIANTGIQYAPTLIFNNCKFISNAAENGGVATLKMGKFAGCSFINNTANYGGAIVLLPYIKSSNVDNGGLLGDMIIITPDDDEEEEKETVTYLELTNVIFENNIAEVSGKDIYLTKKTSMYSSGDDYEYTVPLTITFNDLNVTGLSDNLVANVDGPCGAVVSSAYEMTFKLNGTKIGSAKITDGVATLTYDGFENGGYVLSGNTYLPSPQNIINTATINVKLENISESVEYWVSPAGDDVNGTGNETNPFKSISYAVKTATKNSRNIIIHLMEGNYTGDLNTNLALSSMNNLTIVGAGIDKTIVDGENTNFFAKINEGNNTVTVSDLTITNMLPVNVEDVFNLPSKNENAIQELLDIDMCPITVLEGANVYLNKVNIVNNHGGKAIIENYGNLVINNSIIDRNGIVSIGVIIGHNTYIDNSLLTSNFAVNNMLSSDLLVINNSVITNCFNMIGYSLTNGGSSYLTTVDVITIIENTNITNDGDNSALNLIGYNKTYNSLVPAFSINRNATVNNIFMVNDYKSNCPEYTTQYTYRDGMVLAPFGYIYGSGGKYVNVYNSTFKNFKYIWSIQTSGHSEFNFDGCVFENITRIAKSFTPASTSWQISGKSTYNITNSVFLNTALEIDRYNRRGTEDPNCTFENNYWGSNDKPVITFINPVDAQSFEPETWITLYSEDLQNVIKNVTDGENSTAYLGNAPIRTDYTDNKGALDYAVVFGPVGYLLTTDDENNVILNASEERYPFVAADPMDYRTPTVIVITGFEGDLNIVGILFDIVGNPIANATITSTFADLAPVNTTTDANGTFKVKAGKNGVLKVVFAGDDTYFDTEGNLTFANAGKTAKTFINFNEVEGDFAITGVLVDDEGTPIANAAIKAIINSNTTVNTTTDDKGAFKVQGLSNCVIDVIFAGDDVYNPSNATITLNNLAPIRAATVIEGNNYTQNAIEYKLGERGGNFTVQLKDASGKALANKTVLIGYNGKCLERTTDENGYANVQINLASENRLTFAVAFLGDDEYNATMSVYLITITKKPVTISAPDKTYKASAKTKSYTVTLSTVKGVDGKTYFGAGKKVTLKVDGKTYTAKTNDKGQATFKLNMAKKGTFKATVSYAGDGTYQAATKTSKIKIN